VAEGSCARRRGGGGAARRIVHRQQAQAAAGAQAGPAGNSGAGELAEALLALEGRVLEVEGERAAALLSAGAAAEGERAARARAEAAEAAAEALQAQLLGSKLSMARLCKQLEDAGVGTVTDALEGEEGGGGEEGGEGGCAPASALDSTTHLAMEFWGAGCAPAAAAAGEAGGGEGDLGLGL
jgi:hypothetical protein